MLQNHRQSRCCYPQEHSVPQVYSNEPFTFTHARVLAHTWCLESPATRTLPSTTGAEEVHLGTRR